MFNSISVALNKFYGMGTRRRMEMGKINFANLNNYKFKKILKSYEDLFDQLEYN